MQKILMPLPAYGSDPTEVAIPWKILTEMGIDFAFATPHGKKAAADERMVTGKGLGIWKSLLQARQDAVTAYHELEVNKDFCHPIQYDQIDPSEFAAIILPGGHDKGVKEYLESKILQRHVTDFFVAQKPVAAICHGVLVAARSIHPATGRSVLEDYKSTALLKTQELAAYNLTRLWLDDYYLTYPGTTVEEEVSAGLSKKEHFIKGPTPLHRDTMEHLSRGFALRDRNYISARWPGDAYTFALALNGLLKQRRL